MRYANPVFVFTSVWITVLLLHSMRLLAVLEPINLSSILLVTSNIVIFFMMYTLLRVSNFANSNHTAKCTIILDDKELSLLEIYSRRLFIIWSIGTLINIFYSGGVPLYWMITDSGRDYKNYGIPTFGGFVAAINAFLAVSYSIIYLKRPKISTLVMLIIQISWPIIAVSRGNFTYILLEIVGAYLLLRKGNLKTIVVVLFGFVVFVYLFGLIGDFRLGADKAEIFKRGLMNPEYIEMADFLPSGILYVYAYVTTPFNNIVYNISSLNPSYMPFFSTVFLFPTIIRDRIFRDAVSSYVLVNETFNTSTFYVGYLYDFGIIVTVLIVSLLQFGTAVLYLRALKGSVAYIIAYSVAFQCIALSIFNDNFTMQMSIFQIFLAFHFRRECKKRRSCFVQSNRVSYVS